MRTIYRDIVSGLIFSKDDKLLMGMKDPKAGGVYSDCWHLPGGGIDKDESQLTALKREILEEVGIDISNSKVTLVDDLGRGEAEKVLKDTGETVLCTMTFYVYRVDVEQQAKEIKTALTDDLFRIAWVHFKDLKDYKLTPPSVSLFKRLGYIG